MHTPHTCKYILNGKTELSCSIMQNLSRLQSFPKSIDTSFLWCSTCMCCVCVSVCVCVCACVCVCVPACIFKKHDVQRFGFKDFKSLQSLLEILFQNQQTLLHDLYPFIPMDECRQYLLTLLLVFIQDQIILLWIAVLFMVKGVKFNCLYLSF